MSEALSVVALRLERRHEPRLAISRCRACDIGCEGVVTGRAEWHLVARCPWCGRTWLIDKARHQ